MSWISVLEQLPEMTFVDWRLRSERVLVQTEKDILIAYASQYENNPIQWRDDRGWEQEVSYWMSLPEKYVIPVKTLSKADALYEVILKGHSFAGASQDTHTPRVLVNEILDKISLSGKILVMFNLEFIVSLMYDYAISSENIVFYSDHEEKTQIAERLQVNTITDLTEYTMKFDCVIGNPPYQGKAALHQQFFNKAVDLVEDDGVVAFIQPATPYFNKKSKKKAPEQKMIENINQFHTEVKMVNPDVFENAAIATDLAITTLTKTESDNGIDSIEFKNGEVYTKVEIEDISITQMNPNVYRTIRQKILAYIEANGCLQDRLSTDTTVFKASISKVRGNTGTDDFFTFIPRAENRASCKCADNYTDFGIEAYCHTEVDNIFDYLESYVARMGLALSKFNGNNHMGELKTVPLVDFTRTYSDQELFDLIGLNDKEIKAIKSVISNYYGR